MAKPPKKLRPIRMPPPPMRTILGDEDAYKAAVAQHTLNWVKQYLEQISQVAELAGISVAEILDNKPLMTFAEITYGLGKSEPAKKSGRPEKWSDKNLLHLWAFVEREKSNYQQNVSETLRAYTRHFEVGDISPESLNVVYHSQALKKSHLVELCKKVFEDPEKLLKEEFRKEDRLNLIGDLADRIGEYTPKKPVGKP